MASYAEVKSRGAQSEVTDANREESRQKTGNKGAKQKGKEARERPQVEPGCHLMFFFFRPSSQHSSQSPALQKYPAD